jgi:hypothetical protein
VGCKLSVVLCFYTSEELGTYAVSKINARRLNPNTVTILTRTVLKITANND